MARIESGELHPVKEWSSVPEIIDAVLERCAATLAKHQVRVELQEELPLVKVDARLLASALANLVENAAQYSEAQSEVVVRAVIDANVLTMSIRDKGPGIMPQDIPRIFDKFYRVSSRSVNRREGTGMGLAITRGIVEAHSGRIWVESMPGLGSTFSLSLPVEVRLTSLMATIGEHG
jgi:two-component system sensor histidine kinase KdpD